MTNAGTPNSCSKSNYFVCNCLQASGKSKIVLKQGNLIIKSFYQIKQAPRLDDYKT
jgi:hypothetical protein